MTVRNVVRLVACWIALAANIVVLPDVWAGGFSLDVAVADASVATKGHVLTVRPFGCHNPSDAEITATAEGSINGKRQSLPLKLTAISHGLYAIRQEWPSEGTWVLAIRGRYNGAICTALVRLGANGKVIVEGADQRLPVRVANRELSKEEIESALTGKRAAS